MVNLKKTLFDADPGRRACWILEIDVYDLTILHRKGKQHTNADFMSRRPSLPMTETKAVLCVISTHTTAESVSSVEVQKGCGVLLDMSLTLSVDINELKFNKRLTFV